MERSKQREHEPSSPPPAPYPFPASNSPNPNHSPRLPSLLNPATAAHPPSTQQGTGLGHGHGHSASFSGPSVNYRNNLLSPVSSPPPPHPVSLPGTHPSSPTILGPPFQPNESLGSKSVGRGRGHSESTVSLPRTDLDLPSSPPSAASFDVLSSAPFVSPSTTIRPDSSVPFSSPGEQYEGGLGASRSSSSSKLDLSSSFRMRSRSASRTRVSGSISGEDGGAQSPSAMTQNPSRSSLTSWWKHPAQGDAPAQPQSGQIIPSSSTPLSSSSRHPSPHAVGQGRGRAHTHSISRPWHTKSFFDSHSAGKTDKSRRHTVATTVEAAGARKSTTPTTPVATLNETTERKDASEEGGGESSTEGKNSGHDTVPLEQMQNWETTRKRVAQAASSILGTSALVAHEILLTSVELFELAPVPGLAAAARTLLEIWDSVQEVDSNRLQCLRLTERCADILLSVRQEVYEAGEHVSLELKLPIAKLSETFQNVHNVLAKQAARPFLQRYLKRDEISKQLQQCDMDLHDALGMFSLTIQVRILKQVRASEAKRQKETEELLKNVLTLVNRSATSPTPPVQSPPAQSQPVQSPPPSYAERRTASFIQSTSAEKLHTEQRLGEEQRPPFPYGPTLSSNDPNSFPYTTALPPQPLLLSGSSSGEGLDGGAVTNPNARGEAITVASASQQSLLADIPGLQGLPASSSHSSLSLDVLNEVSTQAQGLELGTSVVPTVSVTPSSRPSTASRSSTDTTPKQHPIPVPPVQLIPTRSTIEAGAPVLDAIRNQLVTSSSSQTIIPSSSTLTRIGPSTLDSTSTTSLSGMPSAIPIPPALIPSPSTLPASLVLPTLLSLTKYQNALDAEGDYVDLRNVMRAALSKGSDVEMMRVLGLGLRGTKGPFDVDVDIDGDVGASKGGGGRRRRRLDAGEIVEAIKTLQRAQEALLEKERWEATLDKREGTDGQGVASDEKSQIHDDHVHGKTGTDVGSGGGERPGFYRRGSASSAKALAKIKRRMSIQSSYSSNSIPSQPPTPLNETIIDEEVEVEEPTEVGGVRKAVVMRKGTSGSGGARLLRSKTTSSSSSSTSKTNDSAISQAGSGSGRSRGSGSGREGVKEKPNTLDKEFIESSIDALRRLSRTTSTDKKSRQDSDSARELPSWTITRFEIDPEEKIGVGFFSDVFKGTWRAPSAPSAPLSTPSSSAYVFSPPSRTVAIKVLAETTPRSLFLGETAIWKKLNHPNVLELYGASSASGDPPWFFVSPYLENGSLVEFLRRNSTPDPISGKSKLPTGLVLPGNTAYDRYVEGVTTIAAGGRVRTGSLPGYPGWNGGGLGTLVGTHAVHASDGMGLGASAAHPSGNAHVRGRSGSGSTIGGSSGFGLGVGEVPKEWDLLRFMHEIAKGMEYLHSQGVLHGDLKAANVLVDDRIHCVIGDFGQSEMRSEAYRISGTPPPHGTLRWQAPELMAGSARLTVQMDVYAFAISCTEVLSLGRMPWPFHDDDQVRDQILRNQRPTIPATCFSTPNLVNLIQACWATDPFFRPEFSKVASELKALRRGVGTGAQGDVELQSPQLPEWPEYDYQHHHPPNFPSPDLHPIPLPGTPPQAIQGSARHIGEDTPSSSFDTSSSSGDASFRTAREVFGSPSNAIGGRGHRETTLPTSYSTSTVTPSVSTIYPNSGAGFSPGALPVSPIHTHHAHTSPPFLATSGSSPFAGYGIPDVSYNRGIGSSDRTLRALPGHLQMLETVIYTPSRAPSSRTSSIFTSTPSESQSDEEYGTAQIPGAGEKRNGARVKVDYDGYDSPPPANDVIAEARNERRYRLLLVHEFHPSLTLPLWSPTPVALGAVGYLSKPKGEFITLFNAFNPQKSANALATSLPSVHGYGKLSTGSHRQDKRNAAQRGLDAITGLLTFKGKGGNVSQSVSRHYSQPLRAGHKVAHLFTETTMYRYVENLDAPKKWFKANVNAILDVFGPQHHIQKEDLFFIIGTLDTPEHALFVSHNHADGQLHFNIFTSSKSRQPWGTFTTDTETSELGGPSYHEPVSGSPLFASRISFQGNYPWNTVLIARLRFKPDVLEPTSL